MAAIQQRANETGGTDTMALINTINVMALINTINVMHGIVVAALSPQLEAGEMTPRGGIYGDRHGDGCPVYERASGATTASQPATPASSSPGGPEGCREGLGQSTGRVTPSLAELSATIVDALITRKEGRNDKIALITTILERSGHLIEKPSVSEDRVEAVADAIDAARFAHPTHPRERPRPFREADSGDREYATRLAKAALSAASVPAGLTEGERKITEKATVFINCHHIGVWPPSYFVIQDLLAIIERLMSGRKEEQKAGARNE